MTKKLKKTKVGIVVPHIFFQDSIIHDVIFSPGTLALSLADGLTDENIEVTLFSPGKITSSAKNITADLSYFENELQLRDDTFLSLLKKHPFTFVTLARQVQSELISRAYQMANDDQLDIIHIYTNEEDIALPFSRLCKKPVVFTHHDPFNFLVKYKNNFPKYKDLRWISLSYAQRKTMPESTNWVGNIYHGLDPHSYTESHTEPENYIAYMGRIIEPKGVHLAISAVEHYNRTHEKKMVLKIAGKHYADHHNDTYWKKYIEPALNDNIQYVGYIKTVADKNAFLSKAQALLIPSIFDEPFGMVMIEALASGTPIVGLDSGAIPEIILENINGIIIKKQENESQTVTALSKAFDRIPTISRSACRKDFETRFTLERMCREHAQLYEKLTTK